MNEFLTGDRVVFTGDLEEITPLWRSTMRRAMTEPLTVVNAMFDFLEVEIPFSAIQGTTVISKRLVSLYTEEPVDTSELMELL